METETEENVRDGVRAWKELMPYKEADVGGMIYIGVVNKQFKAKLSEIWNLSCPVFYLIIGVIFFCGIHFKKFQISGQRKDPRPIILAEA